MKRNGPSETHLSSKLCLFQLSEVSVDSIDLIQPDSKVVQPGQSLTISCQVSGYSLTDNSYATGWIRQREGKPMDWISHQWGGGNFYQNDALKNKFSYSRDTSAGTVTITGQNLQAEDSAVYYCARDTVTQETETLFDYWGKGTTVTVTSDTPTQAPNVFPLMPCGPQSRDTVTLGCLAVDFTPSSLTFSWTQGSNNLENITQYPSILKNDKYLGISQVEVSRQDWDAKKTFQCAANHLGERTTSLPFTKQDVLFRSPNLTTSFSLDEEKQQASFYCFAKDFSPRTHEIIWQKVGSEKASILDETSVFSEGRNDTNGAKLYSAASLLTVNPTELTSGATFTCVFKGKGVNNTDVLEKVLIDNFSFAAVDLKIIGPTYRDILVKQSGKITCQIHVNNGELEKMLWENENEVEMAGTVKNEGLKKKEELVLDITYDEWHQGSVVYFLCFLVLAGEHVQRPSVFMLPPVEHAKNKEVTLTCSVKDFFPEEVFIAWLVDDDVVDSKYKTSTTSPVEKQGSYLVYSQLTLTDDQWKQSGVVYSCAVYHESITNSTRSIVRSIGFSTDDKNNLVNLNLNISEKCKA
uniref:Ig-like domain-containing protein n=1 Tax=Oryzias latipes TaxID=8090 RepID=A0A3B3IH02_ORYLA